MKRALSREYLEEALKLARRTLPGWAFAMIQSEARARVGGRSAHRTDEPNAIEKLALADIRPGKLRDIDDEDLRAIWLRLHQWYSSAKKRKRAVENIVNAALWTEDEMKRRQLRVGESALTEEIDRFRAAQKDHGIVGLLRKAPKELVAVKNFVSIVGSTAKSEGDPKDLDVLVRATNKDDHFGILSENIWLPIRNALDPEKEDRLHFIDNPQGPHGDFIGAYDLVMRRKDDFRAEVIKTSDSGLIAALWIPDKVGKKIAIEDGETVDDLHCTLAYFGKVDELPDGSEDKCIQAVTAAVKGTGPLRGKIGGIGKFNGSETSDGKDVVYASLDVPGLVSLRERIVTEAEKRGLQVSRVHDFTPHVTLAYVDKGCKEIPNVKSLPVEFDAVFVAAGELRHKIRKADIVPTTGPKGAALVFVGASPSRVEMARKEPFVGPAGETFNEIYLEPLGLKRADVVMTNSVPQLLTDDCGKVREPTDEEIGEWRGWLSDELDKLKPRLVVALGQTVRKALGDRADFVLPHPSAIRRFGDSGEVGRKMKALQRAVLLHKAVGEEGRTRSDMALDNWDQNWHEMLPTSGKGRFVYQQHWIGLDDEEIGLSDKELLDTNNALHGDIRLEGDNALWGFAVFLGKPADNRAVGGDKLLAIDKAKNLQGSPKLAQPKEWLNVGVKKPHVATPGEPGAFAKTSAKFFALDHGTYELGMVRKHGVEVFLDGKHLKGRYLFQFAPVGEKRIWLIDKPADQKPMAERLELGDVITELRRKRQEFLIWAKPGEKPQKIDVKTGKVAKSFVVPIVKADEERQIVYGVVLDPYGRSGPEEDAHNDWIPPAEVEKTAHEWFKASRGIGFGHPGLPGHKRVVNADAVESHLVEYPSASDYEKARRGEPHRVFRRKYGADIVHSGAWILGTELGDAEWAAFKKGEINAYSIEGVGSKERGVSRSVMPAVTFVDVTAK